MKPLNVLRRCRHLIYSLNLTGYYNLGSYTTYVVCANFIYEWREDLLFKVDYELKISETFNGKIFFSSEFLLENCLEKVAERNISSMSWKGAQSVVWSKRYNVGSITYG